jgi:hypothetical protein
MGDDRSPVPSMEFGPDWDCPQNGDAGLHRVCQKVSGLNEEAAN